MKLSVTCDNCSLTFMRYKSHVDRGFKKTFCSNACFAQSLKGTSRSLKGMRLPLAERFDRFWIPEPNSGCYLWQGAVQRCTPNYWQASFNSGLASRMSWQLAHGEIPPGKCVLHKCDNPLCVNPDHLFLGTRKENTQDMWHKGRAVKPDQMARGEAHPRASITAEQARMVRDAQGTLAQISRQLGIKKYVVREIRNNRTWRHI